MFGVRLRPDVFDPIMLSELIKVRVTSSLILETRKLLSSYQVFTNL